MKKYTWNDFKEFSKQSLTLTGKYFIGRMLASIVMGVSSFFFFYFMGYNIPIVMAIIVAVFNLVPILGPITSTVILALMVVFFDPMGALYVVLWCIAIQVIEQYLLTPVIVGKAIEFKPLTVIVVLVLGGFILGGWGVVFAVPIAIVCRVGYLVFYKNKKTMPEDIVASDEGDDESDDIEQ